MQKYIAEKKMLLSELLKLYYPDYKYNGIDVLVQVPSNFSNPNNLFVIKKRYDLNIVFNDRIKTIGIAKELDIAVKYSDGMYKFALHENRKISDILNDWGKQADIKFEYDYPLDPVIKSTVGFDKLITLNDAIEQLLSENIKHGAYKIKYMNGLIKIEPKLFNNKYKNPGYAVIEENTSGYTVLQIMHGEISNILEGIAYYYGYNLVFRTKEMPVIKLDNSKTYFKTSKDPIENLKTALKYVLSGKYTALISNKDKIICITNQSDEVCKSLLTSEDTK
ncbi:hypothetical protein GCM10010995_06570 [Cysteiniphilum litorale]|uniref:Uncharacterized protein n=2 Tax=Fastidiosibacteraceae TaxID=2056687 RepID=A0A8J3E842_9GAMM|nr:hypothetical protein GCM10010995_06570 [Cysteiniphilum litorale]